MPTEIARSSTPSARRAKTPETASRDLAPLSITALAIIGALVVILHVTGADLLYRSRAHAAVVVPADEGKCPPDATRAMPSLPFD